MNYIIGGKKAKALKKKIAYISVVCRYAYENDKAVKLITMDNREHYVPKTCIDSYVPNSGIRNFVSPWPIVDVIVKRKRMI